FQGPSMLIRVATALLFAIPALMAADSEQQTLPSIPEAFCARFPALALCQLRFDLDQAIVELSAIQSQMLKDSADIQPPEAIAKRKSNFVRFGKRSAPEMGEEEEEPEKVEEKRKSNFVRFGKRKSNFVRFG
ncbi:hypothetical protein PMAYCL1PPCAC_15681, partial [Pristionchus mayeri]